MDEDLGSVIQDERAGFKALAKDGLYLAWILSPAPSFTLDYVLSSGPGSRVVAGFFGVGCDFVKNLAYYEAFKYLL